MIIRDGDHISPANELIMNQGSRKLSLDSSR